MSDWWSMENSRAHFSTVSAAVGTLQPNVPREFNRVQSEPWKPSRQQVWKAIHSESSAIITQAVVEQRDNLRHTKVVFSNIMQS